VYFYLTSFEFFSIRVTFDQLRHLLIYFILIYS